MFSLLLSAVSLRGEQCAYRRRFFSSSPQFPFGPPRLGQHRTRFDLLKHGKDGCHGDFSEIDEGWKHVLCCDVGRRFFWPVDARPSPGFNQSTVDLSRLAASLSGPGLPEGPVLRLATSLLPGSFLLGPEAFRRWLTSRYAFLEQGVLDKFLNVSVCTRCTCLGGWLARHA